MRPWTGAKQHLKKVRPCRKNDESAHRGHLFYCRTRKKEHVLGRCSQSTDGPLPMKAKRMLGSEASQGDLGLQTMRDRRVQALSNSQILRRIGYIVSCTKLPVKLVSNSQWPQLNSTAGWSWWKELQESLCMRNWLNIAVTSNVKVLLKSQQF
jgi:hypothetical protein